MNIAGKNFTVAPAAAAISVGGRVFDVNGRGVFKAVVSLIDSNGETRYAMTNGFGYCRFAEVPAGETYVFPVRHKRRQFAPQILFVIEQFDDLNFTALCFESF